MNPSSQKDTTAPAAQQQGSANYLGALHNAFRATINGGDGQQQQQQQPPASPATAAAAAAAAYPTLNRVPSKASDACSIISSEADGTGGYSYCMDEASYNDSQSYSTITDNSLWRRQRNAANRSMGTEDDELTNEGTLTASDIQQVVDAQLSATRPPQAADHQSHTTPSLLTQETIARREKQREEAKEEEQPPSAQQQEGGGGGGEVPEFPTHVVLWQREEKKAKLTSPEAKFWASAAPKSDLDESSSDEESSASGSRVGDDSDDDSSVFQLADVKKPATDETKSQSSQKTPNIYTYVDGFSVKKSPTLDDTTKRTGSQSDSCSESELTNPPSGSAQRRRCIYRWAIVALLTGVVVALTTITIVIVKNRMDATDTDSDANAAAQQEQSGALDTNPIDIDGPSRSPNDKTATDTANPVVPTSPPPPPPSSGATGAGPDHVQLMTTMTILDGFPESADALVDANAPQSIALNWMVTHSSNARLPKERVLVRYALATFAYSTGFEKWTASTGWLQVDNECMWHGIRCTPSGVIYSIELGNNGLAGQLTQEFAHLGKTLLSLDISDNKIAGKIPSSMGTKMSKLKLLQMQGNRFEGPLPPTVGGMTSLRVWNLQDNLLSGAIPATFELLTSLESVDMHHNELEGSIPTAICDNPELHTMIVDCAEVQTTCSTQCFYQCGEEEQETPCSVRRR